MMSLPRVSVLMTVYNREKYIAEAIESVLASTFEDFELIIVDDGSKDASLEIARRYETDTRVRVHVNERNLGDYPNRNRAAELACGEYLKYVDADDMIYPHGLAVMVEGMELHPEAGLGLCKKETKPAVPLIVFSPEQAYRAHFRGNGFLGNAPTSTIIRRRCFLKTGGFSGKRFIGDCELWLRLAALYPVVLLPVGLTWWRQHDDQESNFMRENPDVLGMAYRCESDALRASCCPLNPGERDLALRWLTGIYLRRVIRLGLTGHPRIAYTAYRLCRFSFSEILMAWNRESL